MSSCKLKMRVNQRKQDKLYGDVLTLLQGNRQTTNRLTLKTLTLFEVCIEFTGLVDAYKNLTL